mgnify:CR=1 FL=1
MNELLVAENQKEKRTHSDWVAPDTQRKSFFDIDESLQGLARRGAGTVCAVIT